MFRKAPGRDCAGCGSRPAEMVWRVNDDTAGIRICGYCANLLDRMREIMLARRGHPITEEDLETMRRGKAATEDWYDGSESRGDPPEFVRRNWQALGILEIAAGQKIELPGSPIQ